MNASPSPQLEERQDADSNALQAEEQDHESSAASSLVFSSDEEQAEGHRAAMARGMEEPEDREEAEERDDASLDAGSSGTGDSRRSRSARSEDHYRRLGPSSRSTSSSSSPTRDPVLFQGRRAGSEPFPNHMPPLNALLPQGLLAPSGTISSSFSSRFSGSRVSLPPERTALALHYLESAHRAAQKRSREQAESIERRLKKRLEGKDGERKGLRKGKRKAPTPASASAVVEEISLWIEEEDGSQSTDRGGKAEMKIEISSIEEEAGMWKQALSATHSGELPSKPLQKMSTRRG